MNLSGIALAQIPARFEALQSTSAQRRWLKALRADSRRGARKLAETLERRIQAGEREARRLARMWTRQRALEAGGARSVAGVDEVGVGPLAGPVVAAAVILPLGLTLPGLNDSKCLSQKARERLAESIRAEALAYSIAEVAPAEVDRLNVYHASLEAMRRAVAGLSQAADHLLVDARTVPGVEVPQTPLVGGDASEASIAAASIVAKVYRDALMCNLERRHPGYGFDRHKGYGTRQHLEALRRLGPSVVHRRSFAPVSQLALP
jgi:ribonuclease HII